MATYQELARQPRINQRKTNINSHQATSMETERLVKRCLVLSTASALLLAVVNSSAQDSMVSKLVTDSNKRFLLTYPGLDDPDGEVVLSNRHVVLQRLVVPAGEWEGIHSHPGNQIYVHIKGGEWSGRLNGEIEYWGIADEDGAVGWMDPIPLSAGHESGNTGDTPIDLIYVTLKDDSPIAPDAEHAPQNYPDIPVELLLENDRMIVQRVKIKPGQWTGLHSHPGNQLYIQITGGILSERRGGVQSSPTPYLEAGSVGWMDAIDFAEAHDVGNTGDTTIELVLVTIK
jgi:mannose-6-phosphate isomerase-like protein (cupin superfamily)